MGKFMINSKRVAGRLAASLAVMTMIAGTAAQAEEKPPKSISMTAQFMEPSNNRDADFGFGFGTTIGIPLSDVTEVEIAGLIGTVERASDEEHDWQYSLGVDFLFGTHHDTLWSTGFRPFFFGGAGVMLEDSKGEQDARPYVNFGGGTLIRLSDNGLALRLDTRFISTFDDPAGIRQERLDEIRVGMGLEIPLNPRAVKAPEEPLSLDRDGDGVPDYADRCPGTPFGNAVNEQGCPLQQAAPNATAPRFGNNRQVNNQLNNQFAQGVQSGADQDGDGVPDSADNCPNTSRNFLVDSRGCIIGYQKDASGTRAVVSPAAFTGNRVVTRTTTRSTVTQRPVIAPRRLNTNNRSGNISANGTCLGNRAGVTATGAACAQVGDSYTLDTVNFANGSFTLNAAAKQGLSGLLDWLKQNNSRVIEVRGPTDQVNGSTAQKDLAINRGVEIKAYLLSNGIAADRVAVTGRNANTATVVSVLR